MIALVLSEDRFCMRERRQEIIKGLCELPGLIKEVLKTDKDVKTLAGELVKEKNILLLGRGYNYATCLEGALV